MTHMTPSTHPRAMPGSRILGGALLLLVLSAVGASSAQEIAELEYEPITLATFQLSNGNTVEFYGVPDDGDASGGVGYSEKGTLGESMPVFFNNEDLTILQRFLILAPEDTPLPRMLVDSGAAEYKQWTLAKTVPIDDPSKAGVPSLDQLIAERGVVEELPELLVIELDPLELTEKFETYAQGTPYLDEPYLDDIYAQDPPSRPDEQSKGTFENYKDRWLCRRSAQYFRNYYCHGAWPQGWCDAGRNRKSLSHYSYGRCVQSARSFTALCGARANLLNVGHYWRPNPNSLWRRIVISTPINRRQWLLTIWHGDHFSRRLVHHNKIPNDWGRGWFRAFSYFSPFLGCPQT